MSARCSNLRRCEQGMQETPRCRTEYTSRVPMACLGRNAAGSDRPKCPTLRKHP